MTLVSVVIVLCVAGAAFSGLLAAPASRGRVRQHGPAAGAVSGIAAFVQFKGGAA